MSVGEMVAAGLGAIIVVAVIWNVVRGGVARDRGEDSHSTNSFWG